MEMEEVPAYVHPSSINPDVLTRQHEHRWYWAYYIRGYRDMTRVYINNLARCDTQTYGSQPAIVDRRMMTSMPQEVNDMTMGVLEGPSSSPTRYTNVIRKVQTIICQCMVFIRVQLSRCRPRESVPERGCAPASQHPGGRGRANLEHGGERGGGSRGHGCADPRSYVPPDPFDSLGGDVLTFTTLSLTPDAPCHPSGAGTSYVPPDQFGSLDVSYVSPPLSVGGKYTYDVTPAQ
ncbi:hypothetical protein M9H77_18165 [Catharanthus roseus]|uniref:Uncharacterized protein n=1 Tax=Catharanthus roseus TaxID=4058 RepID=A0ACC0B6N1_CATRO|nr:hypothetical protein M9H77_18165 [Catharanthus roseus]